MVEEKDVDNPDISNESIIELELEADPNENDGKSTNQVTNSQKTKWKCNACSMSFASKDILDFHTEVKYLDKEMCGGESKLLFNCCNFII